MFDTIFFCYQLATYSLILIYFEDFSCCEHVTYYFKEDKYWLVFLFHSFATAHGAMPSCGMCYHLGHEWAFPHHHHPHLFPLCSLLCPGRWDLQSMGVCKRRRLSRLTESLGLEQDETGGGGWVQGEGRVPRGTTESTPWLQQKKQASKQFNPPLWNGFRAPQNSCWSANPPCDCIWR